MRNRSNVEVFLDFLIGPVFPVFLVFLSSDDVDFHDYTSKYSASID